MRQSKKAIYILYRQTGQGRELGENGNVFVYSSYNGSPLCRVTMCLARCCLAACFGYECLDMFCIITRRIMAYHLKSVEQMKKGVISSHGVSAISIRSHIVHHVVDRMFQFSVLPINSVFSHTQTHTHTHTHTHT
jgi:hypothetical protein